jgi:hypothetical protein
MPRKHEISDFSWHCGPGIVARSHPQPIPVDALHHGVPVVGTEPRDPEHRHRSAQPDLAEQPGPLLLGELPLQQGLLLHGVGAGTPEEVGTEEQQDQTRRDAQLPQSSQCGSHEVRLVTAEPAGRTRITPLNQGLPRNGSPRNRHGLHDPTILNQVIAHQRLR